MICEVHDIFSLASRRYNSIAALQVITLGYPQIKKILCRLEGAILKIALTRGWPTGIMSYTPIVDHAILKGTLQPTLNFSTFSFVHFLAWFEHGELKQKSESSELDGFLMSLRRSIIFSLHRRQYYKFTELRLAPPGGNLYTETGIMLFQFTHWKNQRMTRHTRLPMPNKETL